MRNRKVRLNTLQNVAVFSPKSFSPKSNTIIGSLSPRQNLSSLNLTTGKLFSKEFRSKSLKIKVILKQNALTEMLMGVKFKQRNKVDDQDIQIVLKALKTYIDQETLCNSELAQIYEYLERVVLIDQSKIDNETKIILRNNGETFVNGKLGLHNIIKAQQQQIQELQQIIKQQQEDYSNLQDLINFDKTNHKIEFKKEIARPIQQVNLLDFTKYKLRIKDLKKKLHQKEQAFQKVSSSFHLIQQKYQNLDTMLQDKRQAYRALQQKVQNQFDELYQLKHQNNDSNSQLQFFQCKLDKIAAVLQQLSHPLEIEEADRLKQYTPRPDLSYWLEDAGGFYISTQDKVQQIIQNSYIKPKKRTFKNKRKN